MSATAWIVAARRTAVAPHGGAFAALDAWALAAPVLRAALDDAGLDGDAIDDVILGNALGGGGNPARLAALAAGLPERAPGLTLDRQCCAGLDAVMLAARLIEAGAASAILAGGAESHSRRPHRLRRAQTAGEAPVEYEAPPFSPWPARDPDMHEAAAALARRRGVTRAAQGAWAVGSHARARAAREAGRLDAELVAVPGAPLAGDAFTRRLTPGLCRRAPRVAGDDETGVDASTTAVAADAAAVVLVVSGAIAERLGCPALRVGPGACVGGDPAMPGIAPIEAVRRVCADAGVGPETLFCAEVMEAYAIQAMACVDGAGLEADRVNLGGGALARGHPIGASGAILAVRLWHEMTAAAPGAWGCAAIAAAGGLGSALMLRR